MTYGQLAKIAGLPGAARLVGTTLCQLPENTDLPWHRVINAQGKISMLENSPEYIEQIKRLKAEGVSVNNGKIRLKEFQW